jgi:hypothetical protein
LIDNVPPQEAATTDHQDGAQVNRGLLLSHWEENLNATQISLGRRLLTRLTRQRSFKYFSTQRSKGVSGGGRAGVSLGVLHLPLATARLSEQK